MGSVCFYGLPGSCALLREWPHPFRLADLPKTLPSSPCWTYADQLPDPRRVGERRSGDADLGAVERAVASAGEPPHPLLAFAELGAAMDQHDSQVALSASGHEAPLVSAVPMWLGLRAARAEFKLRDAAKLEEHGLLQSLFSGFPVDDGRADGAPQALTPTRGHASDLAELMKVGSPARSVPPPLLTRILVQAWRTSDEWHHAGLVEEESPVLHGVAAAGVPLSALRCA